MVFNWIRQYDGVNALDLHYLQMRIIVLSILLASTIFNSFAQTDTIKKSLVFSGYIEMYYSYDFDNSSNQNSPGFMYSYNRQNDVNLNLGFIKAAYQTDKVRSNLAIMTGTYANANLASEPGILKNIFEANAGVKLSKTKSLWLDAGVFTSHIGFESAIGKDCWNLTRSILADNSPYYESGVKLSYTSNNNKWYLGAFILNGWQRIKRVSGNNTPSFGHQITFRPNSEITLNSSSFIGSDTPDHNRKMRFFHNLYGQFQLSEKFGMILGFDIGAQQKSKGSSNYNTWYSPVLLVQYAPVENINIAARAEYYSDVNGVIINTTTGNGFQTFGYSLNLDYQFSPKIIWRLEGRKFTSKDAIYTLNDKAISHHDFVTTAFVVSF